MQGLGLDPIHLDVQLAPSNGTATDALQRALASTRGRPSAPAIA
jgi:hypothetical protein